MIGAEIYGYRVERAMSEDKGGFGEVYFARHTTSGAEAVLKVLKPEMSAHREIVTRFFNEARAAAAIRHPGIVAVHNVGYAQDRAYLLMERLYGEDLEARLERGPLPLEMALRFLRQAAGAIGAAHERNIVHRDLKPANLFIVADPDVVGGERIKVLDFGIAKLGTGGTMATQGVFGTPAYMSPEQCSSAADVDARSDLYSIGCIAFEMFAGRPPFGHGGLELIAAHLRDEPPRLREVVPSAPAAIEALVSQLLQKRRDARPASCAALSAAIDDIARSPVSAQMLAPTLRAPTVEPVSMPPSPPPQRTTLGDAVGAREVTAPSRRTPWMIIAGGIAVVAGGGAAAMIAVGGREASKSDRGDLAGAAASGPRDAALPIDSAPPTSADAAPVSPPPPRTTFVTVHGVSVQPVEVTRAAYGEYLDTLSGPERAAALPLRDWAEDHSQRPVSWVSFEQAQRYCAWVGGRLLTREEWEQASGGAWGIAAPGGTPGPLREWSATITEDHLALVMGGHAKMSEAQRATAIKSPLAKDTEASAGSHPDPDQIASATIGIRCGQ